MGSKPWIGAGWLLFVSVAQAEPTVEPAAIARVETPTLAGETEPGLALRARLQALRPFAAREASVRTALEQADLALKRAEISRAEGDEARTRWAQQLAEAATSLAERRLSLTQERDAMRAAEAQRRDAKALVQSAKEALARATQLATERP